MWATVGAALKKIAVALLGNPKVLKTIGGIVLGLIIIIVMPVVAIVSIFNGDIEIDTNELQRMVVENLSAEEQAKLQFVEDTMYAIEREMKASGFSDPRVTEAQVLFTLSLYDYAQEADFVSKLVGCFASEQTDEQLIAAVNAAFGTAISAEEFSQVMGAIRSVYIDTSGYIDPCTKNNLDLVEWAKQAKLRGWGYVWGTYGEVLTRSYYNAKAEQYPDEVGGYADFIESNWLGGRTSDCNGLIKGYGWLNPDTHEIEYGTNGMPDIGADTMYANATEKGTIDTIPEIPGLAVWHEGHIGIYIGGGKVIEAMGTKYGVVETELAGRGWTRKCPRRPTKSTSGILCMPRLAILTASPGSWEISMRRAPCGRTTCRGALKTPSAIRTPPIPKRWTAGRTRDSQRTVPATAWRSGPHRTGKRVFSPMQKSRANRLATWICSLIFCTMSWKRNFRTYSPS